MKEVRKDHRKDLVRMKRVVWTGAVAVALLGVAGPVWAQGFTIYLPPNCDLDTQHFLVRNAELYVKAATESRSLTQHAS